MESLTSFTNMFWSVLSIAAQALSAMLIVSLFSARVRALPVVRFFKDKSILVAFVVSLLATAGSLVYSDVIGYLPCKLCWFQRIFMYPQAAIMLIALIRKDAWIRVYGLILSAIGAGIALFHYVGQLGWNPFGLECLALGQSAECAKNFVLQLGYVTIPLMSFSAFLLIALSFAVSLKKDNAASDA